MTLIEALQPESPYVFYSDDHGFCINTADVMDILNKELKYHWIPCSERLPIARRSVIISTKNWTGEGCYWETTEHHVIWKGYRWNATYWDDEVTAWMPIPEPYKERREE